MPKNENVLEGHRCPQCSSLEPFNIVGSSMFTVYDNGIERYADIEWDDESNASCPACGFVGVWNDFKIRP